MFESFKFSDKPKYIFTIKKVFIFICFYAEYVFIFDGMEEEVKTWKEILSELKKGKSTPLKPEDSVQSVYSAIRQNPNTFEGKAFSVRTHPSTKQQRVYRTK